VLLIDGSDSFCAPCGLLVVAPFRLIVARATGPQPVVPPPVRVSHAHPIGFDALDLTTGPQQLRVGFRVLRSSGAGLRAEPKKDRSDLDSRLRLRFGVIGGRR